VKALHATDRSSTARFTVSRSGGKCTVRPFYCIRLFIQFRGDGSLIALTEPASLAARSRGRTTSRRLRPRPTPGVPRLEQPAESEVRIACGPEELLAAYRLVFRRYSQSGFLGQSPSGIVYSPEFAHGDSRTLVAVSSAGEVTATATIVVKPSQELANGTDSVIPWRKLRSADRGQRLAGVTCLASEDCESGPRPAAFFALTRFLFQYARYRNLGGLVIAIHPRQLRFYQRICPIVPISDVYSQSKLGGSLAVACRIDLDARSLSRVTESVLSWFEAPIPREELDRPGISTPVSAFLSQYADKAA